ncbi:chemotaxis protein [Mesobaculum littorinae]|uniref:Chemotaxis protein methyltransferase n=1 Tax=Mesobaculum littorinae TaxID=2486419 RepID=A0A438AKA4_9RHOB|nr:protein-glutamate O-methyltransferase [Mesobaculum littorinae]RVV99241.1 chemotaxis protein [Mesobaculum littorinae]
MSGAVAPSPDPGTSGSREFPFSDEDFHLIATTLRDWAGIHLADNKKPLVYSRLAKRLRALGQSSFTSYCNFVLSDAGSGERDHFLAALTTNVTAFFREEHHFQMLARDVAPELVARARAGGRVRLWSAACSTGQEAYCIAMTLIEACPDIHRHDVRILATDIDTTVLATASEGRYQVAAQTGLDPARRAKFFDEHADGSISARDDLKRLIAFRPLNLMASWPVSGPFDVIFCRNVAIYFERETQAQIWSRFAELLAPGGALYIGHSERVANETGIGLKSAGITAYRKTAGPGFRT